MYSDDELDAFVKEYLEVKPVRNKFRLEVENLVLKILEDDEIRYQVVSSRVKEVPSFRKKCSKQLEDGSPKYANPLVEIEDLSAVRIICYTLSARQKIVDLIQEHFDVEDSFDVGALRYKEGNFGYQSHHLMTKFKDQWIELPGNKNFADLKCEIQVRTVLQHAWAEIEHDIRYKSERDLPELMKRNFTALAGLLEIADKEFERIQKDDDAYKERVSETFDDVIKGDALKHPKTKDLEADQDFSDEILRPRPRIRELMDEKKFGEAIQRYNEIIESEPANYNVYLGRARAYFLIGEKTKALKDLDEGERIRGKDPEIFESLRDQINQGTVTKRSNNIFNSEILEAGNNALVEGNALLAFEHFSVAQAQGYSRPYSIINKAMACCLGEDYSGTVNYLNRLQFHPGTFFSINMCALRAIASALSEDGNQLLHEGSLKSALKEITEYNYAASALKRLERGLENSNDGRYDQIKHIFDLLRDI